MAVVTRFAPSPTGFLHIGGARTALFNWLYARHHNGQFLLRIEDTDRARSTQDAIDAIIDGMNWLGLTSDEPPVFQSQRIERHAEIAQSLLEKGMAYKCYVTAEELASRRDKGQALLTDIKSGSLSEAETELAKTQANDLLSPFRSPYRDGMAPPSPETPYVIRLRAPDQGDIIVQDKVQGDVHVAAREIDDLILMRNDGTPTYMLAVVVDDHDMGVTQIIRGDDHLTNTFRQLPIYQAMGWDTPDFAHIPLIHGPDGKKLSKRHGALAVQEYREMGYVPQGVNNYLLRLGWSHGDEEFISEEQAIQWFDVDAINKAPSRMDFEKMGHINALHIRSMPEKRIFSLVTDYISKQRSLSDLQSNRLKLAISELSGRGQTIPDIAAAAEFLLIERPLKIQGKARKKLKGDAVSYLKEFQAELANLEDWSPQSISDAISAFCNEKEISIGQIGPPLRTAMTGGLPAPDLNLIVYWLGKQEVLGRIDDVMQTSDQNG